MPLAENLMALASLAGKTVVSAAVTDAWESIRRGVARLLGRGSRDQAEVTERRLDETRGQLAAMGGADLEQAQAVLAAQWTARLADLLEEEPDAESELRALVQEIQALLPAGVVNATDHAVAVAVGRDMDISSSGGGLAAGVISGNVELSGPDRPGPSERLAGPDIGIIEPGAIVAMQGGMAIGQLVYQRAPVAGKPVQLPPRPVCLVGREELLAKLDVRLTSGGDPGPQIVALFGLGGSGKTSVAVEYAHCHLDEVRVAWQFTAEDPAVLADNFGELAAQLGARDVLDSRDPVLTVHGVLADYQAEWLLIFDNVPDRAFVEKYLPPAGRGRVLITTRNQDWPAGQALGVPLLHKQVAAEFLAARTHDQDKEAARKLAAELGGLPLALEQAGAYIQAAGESLADYLELFQHRHADLLNRGEPTGYDHTVATTWALPFERLQQDEPGAVDLLRLLAYCAPAPIPLRLLLQPRPGLCDQLGEEVASALIPLLDQLAADDALAALRRYSLVTQLGHEMVSVHRLVQAVTADQIPADLTRAWRQAAATVIGAAIPDDTSLPENWSACAALLPHAQKALAEDSSGMAQIANYLGSSGSYAAARDLQHRVLAARERALGPEHPDTLDTRNTLAYWTGQAGDAPAARDQLAELVPVREQISGPEDPHTLAARANLAYWTGQAGDAAAACDQLAELVPVRERVSGPEHRSTLINRVNLAQWTGNAGDAAAARDQLTALFPVIERVFGPENPQTLTTQHELARLTGEAGDAAAARDQFAELLPVIEQAYGAEHPQTLAARGNLAYWTGEAGDPVSARDQFAGQLPVISRVLGPQHPRTLANRRNLAQWTGEAGDPAAARDQLTKLLPVIEQILGPQHVDTIAVQTSLNYWIGEAESDPGHHAD